jgi:type II secretory pathway component PulM
MNIKTLKAQGRQLWHQRSPSEQRALRWLGWIVLAALAVQFLWSLEHARRLLNRQLPELAVQAEKADALRAAWQQLDAARDSQATPRADTARSEAYRRVAELGKGMTAEWAASGELLLKGRVDVAIWLKWVAEIHRDYQWIVSHCQISNAAAGEADIDARLTPGQNHP